MGIPMHECAASEPPPCDETYSPWFLKFDVAMSFVALTWNSRTFGDVSTTLSVAWRSVNDRPARPMVSSGASIARRPAGTGLPVHRRGGELSDDADIRLVREQVVH
jgi:hypothetical protein